jgi:hopanoid C-3 methylase
MTWNPNGTPIEMRACHDDLDDIRQMKHKYATFTVLTPLPGTQLYAEREQELLSRKPELFDMVHALLPTKLPLQDFYAECAKLWTNAVPFYRLLPTLARFGIHGMWQRIRLFGAFLAKARTAHLDYASDATESES